MSKITRRRVVAVLAVLTALSICVASRWCLQTDGEPLGKKLSRMRYVVTTRVGWRGIWANSEDPLLVRIGWNRPNIKNSLKQKGIILSQER
jgi:hypothetical protein